MMIDRRLYVATATVLVIVFMFDETFSSNLIHAIGGPIAVPEINRWELGVAGILGVLIGATMYGERR